MEFDTNCYRALLISFSLIHFLTSTAVVLLAAYLTFWNDYFNNGIVPDKYQTTIFIIGFGALLSFIASEYKSGQILFYSINLRFHWMVRIWFKSRQRINYIYIYAWSFFISAPGFGILFSLHGKFWWSSDFVIENSWRNGQNGV